LAGYIILGTISERQESISIRGLAMTVLTQPLIELDIESVRTSRHRQHSFRRRTLRFAARILLVLAFVVGVLAFADFTLNAFERAFLFDSVSTLDTEGRRVVMGTDDETMEGLKQLRHPEELQQVDAAAALLAAGFLIGSSVISLKLRRRR